MSALKIAIVTTLRDAGPMLDSFVTYHLRNGFARLYLFFDDPADPDLARLAGHPMVSAIAHDEVLRERWAMCASPAPRSVGRAGGWRVVVGG